MDKLKKVEVFWLDATYEAGEYTQDELNQLLPVPRSHLGYILNETDTEIRLSPGANYWSQIKVSKDTFDNSLAIPKGTIQKIIVWPTDD